MFIPFTDAHIKTERKNIFLILIYENKIVSDKKLKINGQ